MMMVEVQDWAVGGVVVVLLALGVEGWGNPECRLVKRRQRQRKMSSMAAMISLTWVRKHRRFGTMRDTVLVRSVAPPVQVGVVAGEEVLDSIFVVPFNSGHRHHHPSALHGLPAS